MKIEHWVEWLTPGVFFPEEARAKVETREVYKLEIPEDVYAFKFWDVEVLEATDEAGNSFERRITTNKSPRYVIGKIAELRGEDAIECHLGNWQPLLENDVVLAKESLTFTAPVVHKPRSSTERR